MQIRTPTFSLGCFLRALFWMHRIAGVGMDHLGSSSPSPAKAGSLEQVIQESVQVGFEYLRRGRLHSCSVQPVPVLSPAK